METLLRGSVQKTDAPQNEEYNTIPQITRGACNEPEGNVALGTPPNLGVILFCNYKKGWYIL